MTLAHWLESAFSSDKFNSEKALRYTLQENHFLYNNPYFIEIFLDLAETEIQKNNRLLYIEDIDRLTQKARIMSRHKSQNFTPRKISQEETTKDNEPYSTFPLNPEIYSRLYKQLQNVKYTADTYVSETQGHHIRVLKLKNAQESILKIIKDMTLESQSQKTTPEMQRTLKLEINRWTSFAETIYKRLYRKVSQMHFKKEIEQLEQSFTKSNRTKAKVY